MKFLLCISEYSHRSGTIRFTGLLANLLKASVSLLTVLPPGEDPTAGERLLERAREELGDNLLEENILRYGDPGGEILAAAIQSDYDLLALGAHDHSTLEELLLGSVAHRVAVHAPTSVLVVRKPPTAVRHVLITTAGGGFSEPTVETGARVAQAAGARVTLLHVAATLPGMYAGLTRLREGLPELLRSDTPLARHMKYGAALLDSKNLEAELELRHGVPAEEILRAIELDEFDLLVLGGARRDMLSRIKLPDVTAQLLPHVPLPVLIVRNVL